MLYSSCIGECMPPIHMFNIDLKISPLTDTLSLGDTLWIETEIPHHIVDQVDNKSIDFSKGRFFLLMDIFQLIKKGEQELAFESFSYSSNADSVLVYRGELTAFFSDSGDGYKLRLGLIPETTGTFYLNASMGGSGIVESPDDECGKNAQVHWDFKVSDQHLYIIEHYQIEPDVRMFAYAPQDSTRGLFAFVVAVE
jgi:hypothetical protein